MSTIGYSYRRLSLARLVAWLSGCLVDGASTMIVGRCERAKSGVDKVEHGASTASQGHCDISNVRLWQAQARARARARASDHRSFPTRFVHCPRFDEEEGAVGSFGSFP